MAGNNNRDEPVSQLVLVGKDTHDLLKVAKKIRGVVSVVLSLTGLEHIKSPRECETSFVLASFEGDLFNKLCRTQVRIIGPTVLIKCSKENLMLPLNVRPLFCMSMMGISVCLTGFEHKAKLVWLVKHVHYMGGNVHKDRSITMTHMVANTTQGEKYRYAVSMGKPIMCENWITQLWTDRGDPDCHADHPKMIGYKMKPFFQCCLSFLGFDTEEQHHMEELTIENGGTFAELGATNVTHLIVDDLNVREVPQEIPYPQFVVRGEWFWGCIQMTARADEKLYVFEKIRPRVVHVRRSGAKNRKRKILQDLVAETEGLPFRAYKRRSSSGDVNNTSLSPVSILDDPRTPDKADSFLADKLENREENTPSNTAKLSKRQMVVLELLNTEQNYVKILHTILHTFKAQIENPGQIFGPLLAPQDIKIIFGNIPPIYEAHCKLRDSLSLLIEQWSENSSVGDCIIKRADELMKAYPPFVNFFENTKETLQRCDSSNPQFHAFLKSCRSRPECGRQSLQELLIRPVQRLPSVVLLLQSLLSRTDANNSDRCKLELAIEKVKTVMAHINEDKRRTESQVIMFDIVNDIDGCPPNLLSSNRHFVMKVDVLELSGNLSSRGDPLTLFIFSDSVEICKRRLKVLASSTSKSPAVVVTHHKSSHKGYRHLKMIAMTSIKRVVDIEESSDCCMAFGLICRENILMKEKLYSFALSTDDVSKEEVLGTICKNVVIVLCRPDIETFLARVDGRELNITTNDLRQESRTFSRFGQKVGRAFSINKTPSKLTRAFSGIVHGLSPFSKDSKRYDSGGIRKLASNIDLTQDNLSGSSDTISLGTYSLQDSGSTTSSMAGSPQRLALPQHFFATAKNHLQTSRSPFKWATIGSSSPSKTKYL